MRPTVFAPILHLLWSAPALWFLVVCHGRILPRTSRPFAVPTAVVIVMELVSVTIILAAQAIDARPFIRFADTMWYVARVVLVAWFIWIRIRLRTNHVLSTTTSAAIVLLAFAVFPTPAAQYARALAFTVFFCAVGACSRSEQCASGIWAALGSESRTLSRSAVAGGSVLLALAAAVSIRAATRQPEHTWHHMPSVLIVSRRAPDPRRQLVMDGVEYWNAEFARLGLTLRMRKPVALAAALPDAALHQLEENESVSREVTQIVGSLPADIVVVLSDARLTSYVRSERVAGKVVVVITSERLGDAAAPNVQRNVIAHELGHAVGLRHNRDPNSLMCGRPAPCDPKRYRSDREHYFHLTREDEAQLVALYR